MDLRADQARGARCQLQQRIRVRGDEGGIGAGRVLEQLQLDTELRPEFLRRLVSKPVTSVQTMGWTPLAISSSAQPDALGPYRRIFMTSLFASSSPTARRRPEWRPLGLAR